MMTVERKFEFGMLIAIGMKKSKLKLMLLGETFLITILGVLFGILLSFPIVLYWSENPIRLRGEVANVYEQFGFEALFPTETDPSIFIRQSFIVLVMALLIGLYPLWQVSHLNPVKEIKK
jgi:ABC-type antimicrobial peptide transport system permease subunit